MDGERTGDVLVTYSWLSENSLSHHGVKGMRWGVRKDRSSGRSKKKKKKTGLLSEIQKTYKAREKAKLAEAEAKRAANTRNVTVSVGSGSKSSGKTSYKTLSDAELKAAVQRLSLEKQYRQLSSEGQKGKMKFSEAAKKVSTISAKSAAVIGVLGGASDIGKKYGLSEQQTQNLEKTLKILEIIGK